MMLQTSDESQPRRPPDMTMAIVSRVLDMVSENKLSSTQASELLRSLQLDMRLTAAGKAHLVSIINREGMNMKRQVRVIISDSSSRQTLFEIVNPLDTMLGFVDHFLKLVSDNDFESLVLDGDNSPFLTEVRIEQDDSAL